MPEGVGLCCCGELAVGVKNSSQLIFAEWKRESSCESFKMKGFCLFEFLLY